LLGVVGGIDSLYSQSTDTTRPLQILTVAGFVGAGVSAAAGLTLLGLEPRPKPLTGAHVSPYVGIGSVGAIGRF
jgi:hypothetical protein